MPVVAAIVVGAVVGGGLGAWAASNQHQESKSLKSAAEDAQNQAKQLEAEAKQAEVDAAEKSKEDARKRLASMTQTIYTSPLGITEEATVSKPTIMGS